MPGKRISSYVHLEALFNGTEGQTASQEDQAIRAQYPSQIITIITLPDPRLSRVGSLLTTTDRELRRAVNVLGGGSPASESDAFIVGEGPGDRPRPISSLEGGLWISDVAVGSLLFLAEAFGSLETLLLSRPVSTFLVAQALWGGAGRIRTWRRRRKDPLEGVTARQALEVLKAYHGDASHMMRHDPTPNLDLEIAPSLVEGNEVGQSLLEDDSADLATGWRTSKDLRIDEEVMRPRTHEPWPAEAIEGAGQAGRKITHIRQYPDGTLDIVYIED